METLYRKVAISERLPKKAGFYFTIATSGVKTNQWFMNGKFSYESPSYIPTWWLEEIPDNSQQIEKLEADKAEILEVLKYANRMLKNSKDAMYDENYIESLIQKMKR